MNFTSNPDCDLTVRMQRDVDVEAEIALKYAASIGGSSCICTCVMRAPIGAKREMSDNLGEFNRSTHQPDEMVGARNGKTTETNMGASRTQANVGKMASR